MEILYVNVLLSSLIISVNNHYMVLHPPLSFFLQLMRLHYHMKGIEKG